MLLNIWVGWQQQKMKRTMGHLACAAIIAACAGCASIAARCTTDPHRPHPKFVYGGTQIDVQWVAAPFNEKAETSGIYAGFAWPLSVAGIVDFPLSLVFDTLCLPYDLWAVTAGGRTRIGDWKETK
jgi:uncharacterized protein YceK